MNCIVCNKNSFKTVLTSIKNPRLPLGEPSYEYKECEYCHVWLLDPFPSQSVLNQIYDKKYNLYEETSASLITKVLESISENRITSVNKYIKQNNKILDIGCGNGSFMEQIKNNQVDVYGTEWSEYASKIAREKLQNDHIFKGDIANIPWNHKFDIITAWHVLEHNREPNVFINDLKSKLSSEGYFILEVPNADSEVLKMTKENYAWLSIPEHVTYWNKRSLEGLAKMHGFEVVESITPFAMPLLYAKSQSNSFKEKINSFFMQWKSAKANKGDILRQVWKLCPEKQ
jgi:2-polyprenyl-3-methyl-5-hydroxy-6-metoxy-1,4-benzoquinol methylase